MASLEYFVDSLSPRRGSVSVRSIPGIRQYAHRPAMRHRPVGPQNKTKPALRAADCRLRPSGPAAPQLSIEHSSIEH